MGNIRVKIKAEGLEHSMKQAVQRATQVTEEAGKQEKREELMKWVMLSVLLVYALGLSALVVF